MHLRNKAFLTNSVSFFDHEKWLLTFLTQNLGINKNYQNFHPLIFYGYTRLRGVGAGLPHPEWNRVNILLFWTQVRSLSCLVTQPFLCAKPNQLIVNPPVDYLLSLFLYFSVLFVLFYFLCILCCICQKALGSCADVGLSSFLRINFSEEESASVTVISLKENNDVNYKDY